MTVRYLLMHVFQSDQLGSHVNLSHLGSRLYEKFLNSLIAHLVHPIMVNSH